MSGFAIKYPFFIIMICLVIAVVGVTTVARMPVDLFPNINIGLVNGALISIPKETRETGKRTMKERFSCCISYFHRNPPSPYFDSAV